MILARKSDSPCGKLCMALAGRLTRNNSERTAVQQGAGREACVVMAV